MSAYPDLFAALAAPFAPQEVRTRPQGQRQLQYVTARTVMNRLDTVLGPELWWDTYCPAGEHSVCCALTIRLPDGSTLTKCDAGGAAGMADEGDDDKSAYSDAFKRAAVKFGVGRYLYGDGVPSYQQDRPGRDAPGAEHRRPDRQRGTWGPAREPHDGRTLFMWVKDRERAGARGLLKYLGGWSRTQGYPPRMVDWTGDQVEQARAEAERTLAGTPQTEAAAQEALSH